MVNIFINSTVQQINISTIIKTQGKALTLQKFMVIAKVPRRLWQSVPNMVECSIFREITSQDRNDGWVMENGEWPIYLSIQQFNKSTFQQ